MEEEKSLQDEADLEASRTAFQEAWDQYHLHHLEKARSDRSAGFVAHALDLLQYQRYSEKQGLLRRWETEVRRSWSPWRRRPAPVSVSPWRPLKLWLPGCGTSIGPILYAAAGHVVWASDISPAAIAYQRSLPASREALASLQNRFPARSAMWDFLKGVLQSQEPPGELHFLEHDFRTPFPEGDFDCLLNLRSYQIVPSRYLDQAARVHWEALKPGGRAFFDTINVAQTQDRRMLEGALTAAGFVVSDRLPGKAAANEAAKVAFVLYGSG